MKILTLGSGLRDVFIEYDTTQTLHLDTTMQHQAFIILEEGRKVEVDNVLYRTGGGATNAAVSFARLGHNTASFFKVGNDNEGAFIITELKKEHIDISTVAYSDEYATGTSFIIPCPSGNRAALVYRGASLTIQDSELPKELIKTVEQVYVTTLSDQAADLLPIIAKYAHEARVPLAVNPGTTQMEKRPDALHTALPHIDILIVNRHEATLLMQVLSSNTTHTHAVINNTHKKLPKLLQSTVEFESFSFNLSHFFATVHQLGPRIVAVTNGAEGVYASNGDVIFFHPSIKTRLVSSLGAGDAFGSCFVGSLLQGHSMEEAMLRGVINSASVINYLDAKEGLLTTQQLEQRVQEVGFSQVLTFKTT